MRCIDTVLTTLEDAGVEFVVRRATSLKRKEAALARDPGDPFARPEPELFVADLSATHYALLNKYNVLDRHLLVITRADVDQDAPLDAGDFEALTACMAGQPVLGFYNGDRKSTRLNSSHIQKSRMPSSA